MSVSDVVLTPVATFVTPDAASVTLNFRYAPDRNLAEAEAYLRQLLAG